MRRLLLLPLLLTLAAQPISIAALSHALSEPGGEFDTDNLISNEASYLDAIPALERAKLTGGVYLGVGPDQNFSYIAALEPRLALLIDLRRDNLLEHLLFKAFFEKSTDRVGWLALLLGRQRPSLDSDEIEAMVKALDRAKRTDLDAAGLRQTIDTFGFNLSNADHATILRYWKTFASQGFRLKFESHGRGPRDYYPDLRALVLARDSQNRASGFLGSEAAFQRVKRLHAENRIVPITGDLAGQRAMGSIARYLRAQKLAVSAIYVSNVEQYLFRHKGAFEQYLDNLRQLPVAANAVVIRSLFGPYARGRARNGAYSAQVVEPLEAFTRRRMGSYQDVVRFGVE